MNYTESKSSNIKIYKLQKFFSSTITNYRNNYLLKECYDEHSSRLAD